MSGSNSIFNSFGHDYSFFFYNAKLIGSSKLLNLARTEIPPVFPDQDLHRSDLICFKCLKHLESLCQSNFHPGLLILCNERLTGSAKVHGLCLKDIHFDGPLVGPLLKDCLSLFHNAIHIATILCWGLACQPLGLSRSRSMFLPYYIKPSGQLLELSPLR